MSKRNSKRLEIIELEHDINDILADMYKVSNIMSKNAYELARELIKLGYKKEKKDGTQ